MEMYEKRGVQAARNGPGDDRTCWPRAELGIHGLNRWTATCMEMYEKRGVQAAFKVTKRCASDGRCQPILRHIHAAIQKALGAM